MDVIILIMLILEMIAGVMLLIAYFAKSKNKKYVGIASIGCVLGVISSFLLIMGLNLFRNFLTRYLLGFMIIVFIGILLLTLIWRKTK
jgi:uncharacterized membrane protein